MRRLMIGVVVGLWALLSAGFAIAGDIAVGSLIVENPWSRATPGGAKVGAGYLSLINIGAEPDRLISAKTDVSERVEFHSLKIDGGIMKMRKLVDGVVLKPRSVVSFKPGGYHLMLIGLKKPLMKDQDFNVTLRFEKAGDIDVLFLTTGIGGKSPYPANDTASGSASGSAGGLGHGSGAGSGSVQN